MIRMQPTIEIDDCELVRAVTELWLNPPVGEPEDSDAVDHRVDRELDRVPGFWEGLRTYRSHMPLNTPDDLDAVIDRLAAYQRYAAGRGEDPVSFAGDIVLSSPSEIRSWAEEADVAARLCADAEALRSAITPYLDGRRAVIAAEAAFRETVRSSFYTAAEAQIGDAVRGFAAQATKLSPHRSLVEVCQDHVAPVLQSDALDARWRDLYEDARAALVAAVQASQELNAPAYDDPVLQQLRKVGWELSLWTPPRTNVDVDDRQADEQ